MPCSNYCKGCNNYYQCNDCQKNPSNIGRYNFLYDKTCGFCPSGQSAPWNDFECTGCSDSCYSCSNNGRTCNGCKDSREKLFEEKAMCGPCDTKNWYVDGIYCRRCHFSCETCIGSAKNQCITCKPDIMKYPDSTCIYSPSNTCYDGFYASSMLCMKCPKTCKRCTSASVCTECQTGYDLNTQTNQCEGCNVGEGKYIDGLKCLPCPSNCQSCENGTSCLKCFSTYYLKEDKSGCTTCESVNKVFIAENICRKCSQNCNKCVSLNPCTECENGYYINSSDNGNCAKCTSILNCKTCADGNKCETCDTTSSSINKYLYSDSTLMCGDCQDSGYYIDTNKCLQCPRNLNCQTCTNNKSCTSCKPNFFLTADNQCIKCDQDRNQCSQCKKGQYRRWIKIA